MVGLVLVGLHPDGLRAQDEPLVLDENVLQTAEDVLKKILDGEEIELPLPDPAQTDSYFRDLQARLEGEYILDLAPLKRSADFLLPLLEGHDSLRDLGAWLRSRRDYFDVLDELSITVPAPSPGLTNLISIKAATNAVIKPAPPIVQSKGKKDDPTVKVTSPVTVEIARVGEEEPLPVNVVVVGPAQSTVRTGAGNAPPPPRPPAPASLGRVNPTPEAVRAAWGRQFSTRAAPASAAMWVPRLKPVFVAAGVPAELVWLAEVESGFDPRARSPAGAVGLYQLMPVTARSLGLSTFPFDQRKSPEPCARAAARYLRELYEQFGDWPLALAAYNAGPARVRNLLSAHQVTTYGAVARHLPAETQLYVPKFDAVLQKREGRLLRELATSVIPTELPK